MLERGSTVRSLRLTRGAGRGSVQVAVLALNGVDPHDLGLARRLARCWDPAAIAIGVDGGLDALLELDVQPDLFVGDGDSVRCIPAGVERVQYSPDKDFSDLAGALGEARQAGVRVVVVAGLTGGRLDHEWANLHELGTHAPGFDGLVAPTPRGLVVVTASGCRAQTREKRIMSVLVLGGAATVTLRGLRWSLVRRRLVPGSRGLSNLTGQRLQLTVHSGRVALVFPSERTPS